MIAEEAHVSPVLETSHLPTPKGCREGASTLVQHSIEAHEVGQQGKTRTMSEYERYAP